MIYCGPIATSVLCLTKIALPLKKEMLGGQTFILRASIWQEFLNIHFISHFGAVKKRNEGTNLLCCL